MIKQQLLTKVDPIIILISCGHQESTVQLTAEAAPGGAAGQWWLAWDGGHSGGQSWWLMMVTRGDDG